MHLIYLSFQEASDKLLIKKFLGCFLLFLLIFSHVGVTDVAN